MNEKNNMYKGNCIFEGCDVLRHIVHCKCSPFADKKVPRYKNNVHYLIERIAMKKMQLSKTCFFQRIMDSAGQCGWMFFLFCVFMYVFPHLPGEGC